MQVIGYTNNQKDLKKFLFYMYGKFDGKNYIPGDRLFLTFPYRNLHEEIGNRTV